MDNRQGYSLLLGILIVLLIFLTAEIINPYLFLEDDNAKQFFPVIKYGMEQLFSGNLPSINMHQLMGTKILEVGTYAVLYPPMLFSYSLSHFILGNDFLMFEIFAILHFALGFVCTFLFLKEKTKSNLLSLFASLAFIFSGYLFALSRGWYYVLPLAIFLPLIFLFNDNLSKKGTKNVTFLGILRGLFFYAGNAQYFVYLIFFELLYLILRNYQEDWGKFYSELKKYIYSMLITIAIIVPVAWAQFVNSSESFRGNLPFLEYLISRPAILTDALIGSVIFPTILPLSNQLFRFSLVHYSGTLFSALFFIGGVFLILKNKKQSLRKISPLFWCGLISIILSLGIFGVLYSLGALTPVIKNFTGPFKFIPFSNFFMISFGAIFLSELIDKKQISRKLLITLLGIFLILLTFSTIHNSRNLNQDYLGEIPINIHLFEEFEENYRFVSIGTNTQFDPEISSSAISDNYPSVFFMNFNFATLFGLDHLGGYEPFKDELTYEKLPIPEKGISNKKVNLSVLEEYNVKYLLVFNESLEFHEELRDLKTIREFSEGMRVLEVSNPKGYVFTEKGKLNYFRSPNGFYFETDFNEPENVTVNLLYKKNYAVKLNGEKIKFYPDDFGRIFFEAPSGKNNLLVYYSPNDFFFGLKISAVIFIILSLLYFFRKKIPDLKTPSARFPKNTIKISIFGLFIVLLMIIFVSSINPSNMEDLIAKKTGANVGFDDFSLNPFLLTFTVNNFEIYNKSGEKIFHSDKVLMKVNKKSSLETSLKEKRFILMFETISLNNVEIYGKFESKNSNNLCKYSFNINIPEDFNEKEIFLKKQNLMLRNVLFKPINHANFMINDSFDLILENKTSNIEVQGKINFERYLNGNLSLINNDVKMVSYRKCIILPLEIKSRIYLED